MTGERDSDVEQALKKQREFFSNVLDKIGVLVVVLTKEGEIVFINESCIENIGYGFNEVYKRVFWNVFLIPQEVEEFRGFFENLDVNELPVERENHLITADGDVRLINWSINSLKSRKLDGEYLVCTGLDISDLRRAQSTIQHRIELEKTISNISSRFIDFDDLDEALNESLRELGEVTDASRTYLFLINQEGDRMSNTHEWCDRGIEPQKENLQDLPCSGFPWWMNKLLEDGKVEIRDVSQMPEEASAEKNILQEQGIKSLYALAIYTQDGLKGFIGLDNVMETGSWQKEDQDLLRIAADITGNTLERRG